MPNKIMNKSRYPIRKGIKLSPHSLILPPPIIEFSESLLGKSPLAKPTNSHRWPPLAQTQPRPTRTYSRPNYYSPDISDFHEENNSVNTVALLTICAES